MLVFMALVKFELPVVTIIRIWKHMVMQLDREISSVIFYCGLTVHVAWPFMEKNIASGQLLLSHLTHFAKKLRCRCLNGFYIHLWHGMQNNWLISIWFEFLQKSFSKQAVEIWILSPMIPRNMFKLHPKNHTR